MIVNEKRMTTIPQYWWLEKLHIAHQLVKYWTLHISLLKNNFEADDAVHALKLVLTETDIYQGNKECGAQGQLRLAKATRRKVRNNSFKERQAFLESKAEDAAVEKQKDRKGPRMTQHVVIPLY
eukprot:scaffold158219_cov32-Attheya_sp.AAC.2